MNIRSQPGSLAAIRKLVSTKGVASIMNLSKTGKSEGFDLLMYEAEKTMPAGSEILHLTVDYCSKTPSERIGFIMDHLAFFKNVHCLILDHLDLLINDPYDEDELKALMDLCEIWAEEKNCPVLVLNRCNP